MDNNIDIQLCSVNTTLDPQAFASALQGTMEGGCFAASIGMSEGRRIDVNDDLMDRLFCDDACLSVSGEVASFANQRRHACRRLSGSPG